MENMTFSQMSQAIADAEAVLQRADAYLDKMAGIVTKRIHNLSGYQLRALKKALSHYNTKTREWQ